jgi:predicted RNase H-like HicB family nuclease
MDSRKYGIAVHPIPQEDGEGYMAFAIDLPGCAGEGDTPEEAVEDVQKAILEWIDEAKRLGRSIPAPGTYGRLLKEKRDAVDALLRAQDEVIKQQAAIIQQKEKALSTAMNDVERMKAVLSTTWDYEHARDNFWLGAAAVVSAHEPQHPVARRKHSERAH